MLHRILSLTAVGLVALAIGVTPAMAGEDDGDPTTPPVTTTPAPAPPPAPAPTVEVPQSVQRELDRLANEVKELKREARNEEGSGGGGGGSSSASNTSSSAGPSFTPVASKTFTAPRGGVQAGAGGTAPDDSGSVLPIGIGLVGLALAGAASGVALSRRRVTE
jgi:hypothetical protein